MTNLSMPGHPRYQPKQLAPFFGYDNTYAGLARVEVAVLQTLGEIGVISEEAMEDLTPAVIEKLTALKATDVCKLEREVTKHDVRAWVRLAQEIVGPRLAPWVHIPLTSYDALDTGRILQYRDAYHDALRPSLFKVVDIMAGMVERFSGQLQIGRTHGQHALPITVGFWLATIISRIRYNWEKMDQLAYALPGKISGAVGAHNAQFGIGLNEKAMLKTGLSFEEAVLKKLELEAAPISTQIIPPEPMAYFLFSCCQMSAALAQFACDCRHLMRSEIAEIQESFDSGQVGSSTMAHKRNPISFENMEGMWRRTKSQFGNVMDTMISEHQRDLVNSTLLRDFPIILINLQQQLNTLLREKDGVAFLDRITVDASACQRNFDANANVILAEPIYICLQMAGYQGDAHELVNHRLVPVATRESIPLMDVLELEADGDPELKAIVDKIPPDIRELLHHPEKYTGDAQSLAIRIAKSARDKAQELLIPKQ